MLKFVCPLIVVEDIARSRQFYEQLLDQKVKYDFGVDVEMIGVHAAKQLLGQIEGLFICGVTLIATSIIKRDSC